MVTIADLLCRHSEPVHDLALAWGAKASSYKAAIEAARRRGARPILVELEMDIPEAAGDLIVDHHGERAGEERSSLRQVFDILNLPESEWSRELQLVAANDIGHVDAMLEIGATPEEIHSIRSADRRAQGITAEQEETCRAAIRHLERRLSGRLDVARLEHSRIGPLTDQLHVALGGPGYINLLVISPGETNFVGEGRWIEHLDRAFPGGWSGGRLPHKGFWGHYLPGEAILYSLERVMKNEQAKNEPKEE